MTDITIILIALGPAALIGCVVMWIERWRLANDWRYTVVPWRRMSAMIATRIPPLTRRAR